MELHINLLESIVTEKLTRQKRIPCLCRVSGDVFEVALQSPLPEAVGVVHGWDRKLLEERVMAGSGGEYTHYKFGSITVYKISNNVYKIIDISFFYYDFGWCPILINGEYAPPGNFWDDDEEDTIGR